MAVDGRTDLGGVAQESVGLGPSDELLSSEWEPVSGIPEGSDNINAFWPREDPLIDRVTKQLPGPVHHKSLAAAPPDRGLVIDDGLPLVHLGQGKHRTLALIPSLLGIKKPREAGERLNLLIAREGVSIEP